MNAGDGADVSSNGINQKRKQFLLDLFGTLSDNLW